MAGEEFLPDWIYTFLILPIAVLFQRTFSVSSRVKVLESKDRIDDEKINKICSSNDELSKEVHELIGRVDEHLRSSS